MAVMNTRESWGWPARLLHWAIAVLIIGQLMVGFYMVQVVGDDLLQRLELTRLHKSWGFVIFTLVALRLAWRVFNPTPKLPSQMGKAERTLAALSHRMLYVLMVVLPVTGWLMASASPLNDHDAYPMRITNTVFGLFELPDPYPVGDRGFADLMAQIHAYAALLMAVILLMHTAAAVKHQVVDRDHLLRRMIRGQ